MYLLLLFWFHKLAIVTYPGLMQKLYCGLIQDGRRGSMLISLLFVLRNKKISYENWAIAVCSNGLNLAACHSVLNIGSYPIFNVIGNCIISGVCQFDKYYTFCVRRYFCCSASFFLCRCRPSEAISLTIDITNIIECC